MEPVVCITPSHCTPAHVAPAARLLCLAVGVTLGAALARSTQRAQTIVRINLSVVGIGTFLKLSVLCVA
jgi:ABC-type Na+ efflux pump permease subunit